MALANRPEELEEFKTTPAQVIVIGSGYGAGVCAARLAEAGARVVVLERGKEFSVSAGKPFPDKQDTIKEEVQIDGGPFGQNHRLGLYNFHLSRDLDVLVGCGLGGTSLINANVSIKPDRRLWDLPVWPKAIRDEHDTGVLDAYYERARDVLQPAQFPFDAPVVPRKLQAMEANGAERCFINVEFGKLGTNSIGVPQKPCQNCGDCTTGCNFEAKKTLCFTYLPIAKTFGAKIFVQCDVRHLEHLPDGRWRVHFQRLVDGTEAIGATEFLDADRVIVGAGVMGTAGILLRSKALGEDLNEEIGGRISGNGDAIAFAYNCDQRLDSIGDGAKPDPTRPVGATILGVIDDRDGKPLDEGIIIEEGAFPSGLASFLRVLVQGVASISGEETEHGFHHWFHERLEEGRDLFGFGDVREGALNRTLMFLLMGHDGADGYIELDAHGMPVIRWPQLHDRDVFTAENALARKIAQRLGGMFAADPLNTKLFLNNLITVHPLGGCPMGDDPNMSAVDDRGRVYKTDRETVHPNLYVADASVIPTSLGVNPLWTISALAERIAEFATRDLGLDPKSSSMIPGGHVSPTP